MSPNSLPQPEAPVAAAEERIGNYIVHPVASMFPLLEGKEYQELKKSIEVDGQLDPIVVDDEGLLIDGRNRMRALLELGRQPVFQFYRQLNPKLPVEQFILMRNLYRRHLTDDQRTAITTQVMLQRETEAAKARQQEAGKQHGRGQQKKLAANSTQAIREPTVTEKIAAVAKGTDHQARQAVAVAKHAPDLLEQVVKGEINLRDAVAKAKKARPKPERLLDSKSMKERQERMLERIERLIEYGLDRYGPVNERWVLTRLAQHLLRRLNPEDRRTFYLSLMWPDQPVSVEDDAVPQVDKMITDFMELKCSD